MNITLPIPIVSYFQAANAHDTAGVAAQFSEHAVVADEGHEHRGGAAIEAWSNQVIADYHPIAEVLDTAATPDGVLVTARVSGTFPGSPVEIRYRFTLEGEKIAGLFIEA